MTSPRASISSTSSSAATTKESDSTRGGSVLAGLEGKVALVTGAGRGLGRTEALELARQGVRVVVNDYGRGLHGEVEDSPAQQVVEEIKAMGGDAVADHGDVADWDAAKAMVQLGVQTWGSLDIVVNNAGFMRD